MRQVNSLFSTWLPVIAWAGLIFALSSVPNLGTDLGLWDTILRKLAHATEYAILGALLLRAVTLTGVPAGQTSLRVLRAELLVLAVGVAYAVSDEIHQSFVETRQGAVLDVLIDAVGVAVGILVLRHLSNR